MTNVEIDERLRRWATSKELVKRLWVFGSRARGDHRPDSDIDVPVEINHSDESNGLAPWMFEAKHWQDELATLFPFPVQLEQYFESGESPTIRAGVARSSRLVFERA